MGKFQVPDGDVLCQVVSPILYIIEDRFINRGGAFLPLRTLDKPVKGALEDTVLCEYRGDPTPFLGIVLVGEVCDPPGGSSIAGFWFLRAVIDRKLFEVRQDGEGQAGVPGIPADLEGWSDIVFNVHGRFLGFHDEFPLATDPEGIVDELGRAPDPDGIFVDHFLVEF